MPTDPLFIVEILRRTPTWAWGALALISWLGLRQTVDREISARRQVLVSTVWVVLSLAGAVSSFGTRLVVVLAWTFGLAAVLCLHPRRAIPQHAQWLGGGHYRLRGSLWPLLTMWAVFALRYVTALVLTLHPTLQHNPRWGWLIPAVYGALSGVFVARTWRILRAARPPSPWQAA